MVCGSLCSWESARGLCVGANISYLNPLTHTMINAVLLAAYELWRNGRCLYNTAHYLWKCDECDVGPSTIYYSRAKM